MNHKGDDFLKGLQFRLKTFLRYDLPQVKAALASATLLFGPTTAGWMDSFIDQFEAAGGSMVMLAKGNRSAEVRKACARHGGFYLG